MISILKNSKRFLRQTTTFSSHYVTLQRAEDISWYDMIWWHCCPSWDNLSNEWNIEKEERIWNEKLILFSSTTALANATRKGIFVLSFDKVTGTALLLSEESVLIWKQQRLLVVKVSFEFNLPKVDRVVISGDRRSKRVVYNRLYISSVISVFF